MAVERVAADFEEGIVGDPVDPAAADKLGLGLGFSPGSTVTYTSEAHEGSLAGRMVGPAIVALQTAATVGGVQGGGGWFKVKAISADLPGPGDSELFVRIELFSNGESYGLYIERSGSNFSIVSQDGDVPIASTPIVLDQWLYLSLTPGGQWEFGNSGGVLLSGTEPTPPDPDLPVTYLWSSGAKGDGGETLVDDLWVIYVKPPAVRMFPRDDGRGMSSAPRIHPAPSSQRVIGGHQ